jgi:hypothetical protein
VSLVVEAVVGGNERAPLRRGRERGGPARASKVGRAAPGSHTRKRVLAVESAAGRHMDMVDGLDGS